MPASSGQNIKLHGRKGSGDRERSEETKAVREPRVTGWP